MTKKYFNTQHTHPHTHPHARMHAGTHARTARIQVTGLKDGDWKSLYLNTNSEEVVLVLHGTLAEYERASSFLRLFQFVDGKL